MRGTTKLIITLALGTLMGATFLGCKGSGVSVNQANKSGGGNQNLQKPLTASFASATSLVAENLGISQIAVVLNQPAPKNITINLVYGGTATYNQDYSALSGTSVAISAGQSSAFISIDPIEDMTFEGDETVVLSLGPSPDYQSAPGDHTMTITEATGFPVLTVDQTTMSVNESAGTVNVTASLNVSSASPILVDLSIGAGSTAQSGNDFNVLSFQEVISPGNTDVSFSIDINEDQLVENDETIVVVLSIPAGALVQSGTTILTILDNDQPRASFSIASQTISEGSSVTVDVVLDQTPTETTVVNLVDNGSTAGAGEFTISPTTATFSPSVSSVSVTITSLQDTEFEPLETIQLMLAAVTSNVTINSPGGTHTVFINDDDSMTAEFRVVNASVDEDGSNLAIYVDVNQNVPSAITLGLSYLGTSTAQNNIDAASPSSVTIPQGQSSAFFYVDPIDDNFLEGNELYNLALTSNDPNVFIGTKSNLSVTIIDDEQPPTPVAEFASGSVSLRANESSGTQNFTVVLSQPSSGATTVTLSATGGTATLGNDYTYSTSVIIPNGSSSGTGIFNINNDLFIEGDETATVTISFVDNGAVLGSRTSTTLTIEDDDFASVGFQSATGSFTEGETFNLVVEQFPITPTNTTVVISVDPSSTATQGQDFILPANQMTVLAGTNDVSMVVLSVIDGIVEGPETIVLNLAISQGLAVLGTSQIVITLDDPEQEPGTEPPILGGGGEGTPD